MPVAAPFLGTGENIGRVATERPSGVVVNVQLSRNPGRVVVQGGRHIAVARTCLVGMSAIGRARTVNRSGAVGRAPSSSQRARSAAVVGGHSVPDAISRADGNRTPRRRMAFVSGVAANLMMLCGPARSVARGTSPTDRSVLCRKAGSLTALPRTVCVSGVPVLAMRRGRHAGTDTNHIRHVGRSRPAIPGTRAPVSA